MIGIQVGVGLSNVGGIGTVYGLDRPRIESRWGRDFPHLSRPSLGPTHPPVNGYGVFPRSKERPGRDTDPSPPSSAVVMKGQSYTSSSPMGRMACTEPQCLYKGALYPFYIGWRVGRLMDDRYSIYAIYLFCIPYRTVSFTCLFRLSKFDVFLPSELFLMLSRHVHV